MRIENLHFPKVQTTLIVMGQMEKRSACKYSFTTRDRQSTQPLEKGLNNRGEI